VIAWSESSTTCPYVLPCHPPRGVTCEEHSDISDVSWVPDAVMLSLVAGGIGLSFTIKSAERRKPDSVVLKEVEDLRLTVELSAIWREDNKVPALGKFIEIVLKAKAVK
jgi:hypothetical protein